MRFQFLRYPGSVGFGIYLKRGHVFYKTGPYEWRTRYIFLSFSRKPIGFVGWRQKALTTE